MSEILKLLFHHVNVISTYLLVCYTLNLKGGEKRKNYMLLVLLFNTKHVISKFDKWVMIIKLYSNM